MGATVRRLIYSISVAGFLIFVPVTGAQAAPAPCPSQPAELAGTTVHVTAGDVDSLRCADLSGATLDGLDLSGFDLDQANLANASLKNANLSGADLTDATLTTAKFDGADLAKADLTGADASAASFVNAKLDQATLKNVDLSNSSLYGASLVRADLTGSNLTGADVTGIDIAGATVTGIKADADVRGKLANAKGVPKKAISSTSRVLSIVCPILFAIGLVVVGSYIARSRKARTLRLSTGIPGYEPPTGGRRAFGFPVHEYANEQAAIEAAELAERQKREEPPSPQE